ncbi:unnamed protein product, partial [Symbiodinium sp. KB8]
MWSGAPGSCSLTWQRSSSQVTRPSLQRTYRGGIARHFTRVSAKLSRPSRSTRSVSMSFYMRTSTCRPRAVRVTGPAVLRWQLSPAYCNGRSKPTEIIG